MKERIDTTRGPSRIVFRKRHPLAFWLSIALLVFLLALGFGLEALARRAEPILRSRVIETLSARFESRVELERLHVSLLKGIGVSGGGLAIYPYNLSAAAPMFSVRSFSFHTGYAALLKRPMKIGRVDIAGMRINLPPKSKRQSQGKQGSGPGRAKIEMVAEEIRIEDAVLTLETDKPGKAPLQFRIQRLLLKSVGAGRPMSFSAILTNPKPVGNIRSTGYFGPWNSEDPGDSPVGGHYNFSNANLATLKGIAGVLSSTGDYQGQLDKIVVNGETDTPDFEIKISGHKIPLHTTFHAIVDGVNGDTYLQPVVATFLRSTLTASGAVVRQPGMPGHLISLDIVINRARIQDLLELGVHTTPPMMTGAVKMRAKLTIPPGPRDIARKLELDGQFEILNAYFANPKIQSGVDELSLRGQGKPSMAKQESKDPNTVTIASRMRGKFNLANGQLAISGLTYDVPGANLAVSGVYGLEGSQFNFKGTARLQATISQMVGGWKGLLLSPLDRYFAKDGAGTEVPFKIDGTRSSPHFELDIDGMRKHGPSKTK